MRNLLTAASVLSLGVAALVGVFHGASLGAGTKWQVIGPSWGYISRPTDQPWPHEDILQHIANDAAVHFPDVPQVNVYLLSDTPEFNVHNFRYYTAHLGLNRRINMGLVATRDGNVLAQAVQALTAATSIQYLLAKTGWQGPVYITFLTKDLMTALDAGALPYVKWAGCGLPDGSQAIVYRRRP